MNRLRTFWIRDRPSNMGIAVFCILFLFTTYFSYQRYRLTVVSEERQALEVLNGVKSNLQQVISYSTSATSLLSFLVKEYKIENEFDSVAERIFSTLKYVDAIELVPKGVICCVYPLKGNEEAVGYNILEDSTRNLEAFEAIKRRELYFAGPLELRQGGMAVIGRLPITIDTTFWGFSAVVIKMSTLLKAAGIDSTKGDFHLNLSKVAPNSNEEVFFLSPHKNSGYPFTAEMNIPNGRWRLSAVLADPYKAARETLPIFLFGLLLSVTGGAFMRTLARMPKVLENKLEERTQSLRDSEFKYLDLYDNSPIMLMSVEADTFKIMDCNKTFLDRMEYKREDLQDKSVLDLYHPDCTHALEEAVSEFKEKGEIHSKELRVTKKNGETISVLLNATAVRDHTGKLLYSRSSWQDITESRKMEDALVKSENHLRTIIETEPECIKEMDKSGRLLEMNPAGLRMIDADSLEQVKGIIIYDLVLPEYRHDFIQLTQKVFNGSSGTLQFKIRSLKGNVRWLETNAVPLRTMQGEINTLLGITRDITDQKKAELALKDSLDRNKAFLDGIPDLMLVLNSQSEFVDYKGPQNALTYAPPEEFLGRKVEDVMPAVLAREIKLKLNAALVTGKLQEHSYQLPLETGELRSYEARYVKINKEEVLVIIRDVTDLKKAEENLLQSKEALELAEEYANLGSWELDVSTQKGRWSKQMFRMFGFDPAGEVPEFEVYLNKIHPDDRHTVSGVMAKMLDGKEPMIYTFRTNPEVLPLRYFKPTFVLVKDKLGKVLKFTGTLMDVTSLVLREEALKASEKKYRAIFENTSEGIYRSTIEGKVLMANPSFAKIFGYDSPDELMTSVSDIGENMYAQPEGREQFLSEILIRGNVSGMELKGKTREGVGIWVSVNAHIVYGENKTIDCIEGTLTDITERKKNRLKIEEQYMALRKYAFINSHKVRGHVASLLGLANLFESDSGNISMEEKEKIVRMLRRETSDLDKVIRELSVLINGVE